MFSYVINHFSPPHGPTHLRASTVLAASLAAAIDLVEEVVVVDGSHDPDPELHRLLDVAGAVYLHDGRRLSFAEGYNLGLSAVTRDWVVLAASDVYPTPAALRSAARLVGSLATEAIGCIIPRLTASDLPLQESRSAFLSRPVAVPLMTLNLNIFPTAYLRDLGGVPERPGGNFNDVILARMIHDSGRRVWLLPERVPHYGSLTLQSGGSSASVSTDLDFMASHHPDLVAPQRFWCLSAQAQSGGRRGLRGVLRAVALVPPSRRGRVDARVLAFHTAVRSLSLRKVAEPRAPRPWRR